MAEAYILVNFSPGADLSEATHALDRPGIKSVHMVMGPYDAVVRCDAATFEALADLAKAIRACPEIQNSLTCPVI